MSIYDFLTKEQVDKIQSIIRSQCDEAARKETQEAIRISKEVYDRLKKGRKAHDITADVYVGFFYPENSIEGLELSVVNNGIYSQPELSNDQVIIHIYHWSNPLNSKLIEKIVSTSAKAFFCIKFEVDKTYRLKTIEVIHLSELGREEAMIYKAPNLSMIAE